MSKKVDIKDLKIPNLCFSIEKDNILGHNQQSDEWKEQRLERGFDDTETWNLDYTIAQFIIPRLERYLLLAPTRDEETEKDIKLFLESMKLVRSTEHYWAITDKQMEEINIGIDLFPKIFRLLWW